MEFKAGGVVAEVGSLEEERERVASQREVAELVC